MRTLWTLDIRGTVGCTVHPKGNPPLVHEPGTSLAKLVGTEEQAHEVADLFRSYGCKVKLLSHAESEEEKEERRSSLKLLETTYVWNCPQCAQCAWFSKDLDGSCALGKTKGESWSQEIINKLLESSHKFKQDAEECPVS